MFILPPEISLHFITTVIKTIFMPSLVHKDI